MRRFFCLAFAACLSVLSANAQAEKDGGNGKLKFNHLDVSVTAGTTGVGFDLAMPVVDRVQLRTGFTFLPKFTKTMRFGVEVGEYDPNKSPEENNEQFNSRFNKLSDLLESMTGMRVNNSVDMEGSPSFNNFKVLVDVFPFKNKHWHVTAGFYVGGTKVAKAVNSMYDMPSLMAASMYNNMYYRALAGKSFISYGDFEIFNPELAAKFIDFGRMTMHIGDFSHDIIAQEDVYYDYTEVDPFDGTIIHDKPQYDAQGNVTNKDVSLRCAKGEVLYHKGDAYRMVPDENSMVRVDALANRFRPYIGFGYGGYIDKYERTQLSFDAGVMFWGGVPKFVTHDGIDLIDDLTNVRSSVQDYLDIAKCFPVYPVVSLRLTQRIF